MSDRPLASDHELLDDIVSPPRSFDAPYAPLRLTPPREIRTLTGLRPYRPSGFVMERAEKDGKILVHNYGHGGCGVTLCWGCAEQAADLLAPPKGADVAVIGAGVIGLTTAIELQRMGAKVTVYSELFTPATTSDVAGAYWYPITLYDEDKVSRVFLARFRAATRSAYRQFFSLVGDPRYGVSWMRFYELEEETPAVPPAPRVEGEELYPGKERLTDAAEAFGFPYGHRHHGFMIDPEIFMPALMEDIRAAGGTFMERRFETAEEVLALDQKHIVNCTGFGAKDLFGDEELTPIRGQISLVDKPEGVDYGYAVGRGQEEYFYMFPRRNSLVLGGVKQVGRADLDIDEGDKKRILDGHAEIAARIRKALGQET